MCIIVLFPALLICSLSLIFNCPKYPLCNKARILDYRTLVDKLVERFWKQVYPLFVNNVEQDNVVCLLTMARSNYE